MLKLALNKNMHALNKDLINDEQGINKLQPYTSLSFYNTPCNR